MKKIISLILAIVLVIFSSVAVAAETTELSFPMINTTGTIYLKGTSAIETNIEPTADIEDSIVITGTDTIPNITSIALEVQGKKFGNNYITTDRYEFENYDDLVGNYINPLKTGEYWKLNLYSFRAPAGGFLVANFNAIYSLKIVAMGNFETKSEKVYNNWGTNIKNTDAIPAFVISKNFSNDNLLTDCIVSLINSVNSFEYINKEIKHDYAFIGNTDNDFNGIVERDEVIRLSYSEYGEGKGLPGFEGLASQVTDFFNHKNNGKIIFNLTSSEISYTNSWEWGGIPSTQAGIFNGSEQITNDIIGLFFNYNTTGSLIAQGKIDKDKIIFDISNILTSLDGHTAGVLENIYYGFIGGIHYKGYGKGLKIESVVLSYEDNAEVTNSVFEIEESITEEDEIDGEIIEDITTDPVETTALEPELTEDSVADAALVVVEGDVIADDDENPRTGVELLMFPFLLSCVGVVCVRKRK